jgi:hypothetical protein
MTTKGRNAPNPKPASAETVDTVTEQDVEATPEVAPAPEEPKPAPKKLDPADDPTAGITGVPVTYVPTPAVP